MVELHYCINFMQRKTRKHFCGPMQLIYTKWMKYLIGMTMVIVTLFGNSANLKLFIMSYDIMLNLLHRVQIF